MADDELNDNSDAGEERSSSLAESGDQFNERSWQYSEQHSNINEFNRDVVTAIHSIRDDVGRQLVLTSDKNNALIQMIGVILAFASILLVQTIQHIDSDMRGMLSAGALFLFLICCLIGVVTMLEWKNWDLFIGSENNKAIDAFNVRRFVDMHISLLDGMRTSYSKMSDKLYILKGRIRYMTLFLFLGLVFMMVSVVIKWV